jgi:hypothetical protein
VAWRSERWEDIVARAAAKRAAPSTPDDRAALATKAQPYEFTRPRVALGERALRLGRGMEEVEVAFPQIYHLEPLDPWPSLAVGWVDGGASHRAILTPAEEDAVAFAASVEAAVAAYDQRVTHAMPRGWLAVPVIEWERVDELPGEKPEGPKMRGYRMAPGVSDPVLATRRIAGAGALWTWIWARLSTPLPRIDPAELILTQRFLYARTCDGLRLRLPADTLRTARRTEDGDAVYVFGRNTELLLLSQPGCPLAALLDARVVVTSAGDG